MQAVAQCESPVVRDTVTPGRAAIRDAFPFRQSFVLVFVISLALVNPWVRGDGVGYYAYVRALLIHRDLNFERDWLSANSSFVQGRVDTGGKILPSEYTATGHLNNHFSVGPAMLWAPFLAVTHAGVVVARRLGLPVAADGYSRPYRVTMAVATAFYGFASLLLSFDIARRYFDRRCAFLATLGIWFASSLSVYMYFNPSWSHAHSAFAVALFLWYWHGTREGRTIREWLLLGCAAGLMINIYYPNAILLSVAGPEAMASYWLACKSEDKATVRWRTLLASHVLFVFAMALTLLPTFITRRIIYGNLFDSGYPALKTWYWTSPKLIAVLFSADHGLLSWTPILIPAIAGLIFLWRRDRLLGAGLLLSFLGFYYFIASYPDWDGLSSFGNRFFISLTPLFILGLAAMLHSLVQWWGNSGRGLQIAGAGVALLIVWNLGLMFQWGTQMIPARGPVSWTEATHNQYTAVPGRLGAGLEAYFLQRNLMMQKIESRDLEHQGQQILRREPQLR
jgi:hypothetical protein